MSDDRTSGYSTDTARLVLTRSAVPCSSSSGGWRLRMTGRARWRTAVPPNAAIMTTEYEEDGPDIMLWSALVIAPPEGTTVPDLMTATGMSRPWIYTPTRTRRRRPRDPSQPWTLASRNRPHRVIVYVYVSPACLHMCRHTQSSKSRRCSTSAATRSISYSEPANSAASRSASSAASPKST